jgi:uncharacterized membrane protein
MSFLRFLMLLALVVWIGGLIFFAFIMAPAAFALLPTRQMAGALVARTLPQLHWMGIVAALVFLAASAVQNRVLTGSARIFSPAHVFISLMLLLTLVLQFDIMPHMEALRSSIGVIDSVPLDHPARMQFDALHEWSTRIEGTVMLLGLIVIYLTARLLAGPRSR